MPSTAVWLSVVVPCYRAEAYLRDCLDSVLAHEGGDLEVVAVDDASPDGTGALLAAYAARDPRVRVVRRATNGGPGAARNTGLEHAAGEYVWFVDADDWLPPGAVGAVLDRLAATGPDVLVVDHAEVYGEVTVARRTPANADRAALLRLAQSACTKVVRRGLLDEAELRFPPGLYEDAWFSPALLLAAERIDALHQVCYCYRQRTDGSITNSPSGRHFEVFDQYARLFDRAKGAYTADLFRVMVDHYLVIAGHRSRLPAGQRRAFFRRMAADYTLRLPSGGYEVPGGVQGLKHRLVRRGAYLPYAALRLAYRLAYRPARRAPDRRGR